MQLVLLIETDTQSLRDYAKYLSGNRFRLVDTDNAKKGLEYAKSAPPDLLLLGLNPQDKDSIETLIYLKKDPITKHIPVLALISFFNESFLEQLKKIGISDHLVKPFKQHTLVPKVNELLNLSEKIRANIVKHTTHHISITLNTDDRVVIVFRSGIKNFVLPEIRNVLNHDFIKSSINKHIAIDIHTVHEISTEELQILEKITKLFGEKKISLITGSHLGNIMKNSELPEFVNLFLSMHDYELFLENPDLDE
ncbi:MAG TPA: response regulator [Leptospiraceae bacterium]|nr:response regulator [Leptospiraceae bacterium]HMW05041.1 response regulator [Leptospiraceae bacterium]HMX31485.1 response regulator [Leptospiraceae bacterium]HMY33595.1 response regulator [Leptospiraceae bacterium]HMZ62594.1 response regulator [Leptospiraceae bacterium]